MSEDEDTWVMPQAPTKEIRLVPLTPALLEEIVVNLSQPARIGRSSGPPNHGNFYGVPSKVVSRAHADLWLEQGRLYVKDLGSASGTFVNDYRISSAGVASAPFEISPGDMLRLGSNYTDDPQQLNMDSTLRCVVVKVLFRSMKVPTSKPPFSPVQGTFGSPNLSDVDLNDLTRVVSAQKSAPKPMYQPMQPHPSQQAYQAQQPVYPESTFGFSPQSPYPTLGFPRTLSNPDSINLSETKKSAHADMYNFELSRKKELQEKFLHVQSKADSALSSVTEGQRDHYIVTLIKTNFRVTRVSVQLAGRDIMNVNTQAWEFYKKLLIQDQRMKYAASPNLEVIQDSTVTVGYRFYVVNHNGGSMMATIEKKNDATALIEMADHTMIAMRGDIGTRYTMTCNGKQVAEVTAVENDVMPSKGSLSRILNVFVDKELHQQLLLVTTVVFGLV